MNPRFAWIVFGVIAAAWLDLWWKPESAVKLTLIQGGKK